MVKPVAAWLTIASTSNWKSLHELRLTWRNTDSTKGLTIFNIKGNKYRLIAIVNYGSHTMIVKELITHSEYNEKEWNK